MTHSNTLIHSHLHFHMYKSSCGSKHWQ